MNRGEFDEVRARPHNSEEHSGPDEIDIDLDEGHSSPEWPRQPSQWSSAARAARLENLFRMLARDAHATSVAARDDMEGIADCE